ncbi:double-strand break repair protein AddB [Parvularcula maris]|uniref:Double-strand break repair protein AddB n=1 Tax=Parvularcula maris TaxID=2965077 RepID=A0A9X2RHB8_9PROT|nr:double-strand break repair protein AddB [Parvularcula maris]MCQ8184709.1 double-strand break repair protein AddB [Parvularcula maris]
MWAIPKATPQPRKGWASGKVEGSVIFSKAARSEPTVYGMAPGRPFFADLVAALLSDFRSRIEDLPRVRIFVPSRRAVRSLKQAFASAAPQGVMLLPKITATADLDEEDMPPARFASGIVPPAPSSTAKRLKLAAIYQKVCAKEERPISWAGALRAAAELSKTSDLLSEHGVTKDAIAKLEQSPDIEEGAAHWKRLVKTLRVVTEDYPRWLGEEGYLDGRARRATLLRDLCARLAETQTDELVLAAGFLGTTPSSVDFLSCISRLPNGAVILPGLDFGLASEAWDAIEAPHPQHVFKCLLDEAFGGISRGDVVDLTPDQGSDARHRGRTALLSLALTPAEATANWAESFQRFKEEHLSEDALHGLSYAKAATTEEEADFIALALREVLEEEGKSAYLVTADRLLARRVASRLGGWGIEIDDSGGTPLRGSYRATFLRLVAKVMVRPSDAVSLAGLVGHQLFGAGLSSEERRPMVQAFDLFLRGREPREGWDGLERSLGDDWRPFSGRSDRHAERTDRVRILLGRLRNIMEIPGPAPSSVADLLRLHLAAATELAATSEEEGEERLFRFEDGEALEAHLADLLEGGVDLGRTTLQDYPEVFDALLDGVSIRPPGGQHPRLAIYGLLEARLQTADLVVVGGLQEGVWPVEAPVDPFLSRGMRKHLGLPEPELDIGRVAHDFLDFAAQPEVLLTRSARQGRSPARASRLMVRLESFLGQIDKEGRHDAAPRLSALARHRYGSHGEAQPVPRPAPRAEADLLPKRLSVSAISTWLRDPYEIFVSRILALRPLPSYAEPFSHAERGSMLHALLEDFVAAEGGTPTHDIIEKLRELLPDIMQRYDMPAVQQQLNAKFLDQALTNFEAFETEARERSSPAAIEEQGVWTFEHGGGSIEITARADRIDRFEDGSLHVIDYKKGGSASLKEQKQYSPQLYLTALMLQDGAFEGLGRTPVRQVSFVKLTGSNADGLVSGKGRDDSWQEGDKLREELYQFEEKFRDWLGTVYTGTTSFPSQLHPYRDDTDTPFDWLARRGEWIKDQGDE